MALATIHCTLCTHMATQAALLGGCRSSVPLWLCLKRSASRRSIPCYRFELENRLLYGGVVGRVRRRAAAPREPARDAASPASGVTIISESGVGQRRTADWRRRNSMATTRPGYLYAEEEVPEPAKRTSQLVSVTRVLQATISDESRAALLRWELAMLKKHGQEGFAAIKRGMFDTGQELHAAVQAHLGGAGPERPLSPSAEAFWRSVRPVLTLLDLSRPAATELNVSHGQLGYYGVLDCVALFRSCPMVMEWKTARRPKHTMEDLYDNPVQAAAYLGAYNYMHRKSQVQRAAVVVAYESGRPASVHVMTPQLCRHYWSVWLRRLRRYRQMAEVA